MKRIICLLLLLCLSTVHGAGLTDWFMKPPPGVGINWNQPLSKGLVGYWLLNERSGNTIYDLSGNGQTGLFYIAPSWVGGNFGPAVTTTTTANERIELGALDYYGALAEGTLSGWVKFDNLTQIGHFITVSTVGTSTGLYLWIYAGTDGSVTIQQRNANNSTNSLLATLPAGTIVAGRWYHFVWMVNVFGNAFYLNGIRTGLSYTTGTAATAFFLDDIASTLQVYLGVRRYNGAFVTGAQTYSQAGIYNRAFSVSEIMELYRDPFVIFRPSFDLKMYWGIPVTGGAPPQIF